MKSIVLVYLLFITVAHSHSACDEISFVTRIGWGAREPTSITNLTSKPLSFFVVHHAEDPPSCYDDESCIERVREIQIFHQNSQDWVDIGYHFLVGENGKVYEGRGWDRQAAYSPGWNNDAYGICFIGNFNTSSPNEKALKAAHSWIKCGIERRYVTKDFYVITHRQSQRPGYTTCPGDTLFNVVRSWPQAYKQKNGDESKSRSLPAKIVALSQALSSVANSWKDIVNSFKTSRSTPITRIIRLGSTHFDQRSTVLKAIDIPANKASEFSNAIVIDYNLPLK
ncbi:unnamed protein product, partial [Rotaria sordida]